MTVSPQTWKFTAMLVFITVGLIAFQATDLIQFIKPQEIRTTIQSAGPMAPLLYLFIYSIGPTFFFPSWVLSIAGGLAFGPVWGTLLTLVGATTGGTVAFCVARYLGRDFVSRLLKGKLKTLDDQASTHGFKVIFLLRLIPLVPFDVLDYIAGLSKIRMRDYILGTFIGIIPGTFAYVYLGSSLIDIFSWQFAVAVGLLILLAFIPVLYKLS